MERLNDTVDWEIFRPALERIDQKARKSAAGCKPTCRVLMSKLLILQRLYGLSSAWNIRYGIAFLSCGFWGWVSRKRFRDAPTVWAFREALKRYRLVEVLFERLNQALAGMGIQMKSGQIIDASFVSAPVQRNTREENVVLKEGLCRWSGVRHRISWHTRTWTHAGRRDDAENGNGRHDLDKRRDASGGESPLFLSMGHCNASKTPPHPSRCLAPNN